MRLWTSEPGDAASVTISQELFIERLIEWIHTRLAPGTYVGPDTAMFEDGLIDSMRVLEIMAYTEIAIGRPLPEKKVTMANFATPSTIARTFLT